MVSAGSQFTFTKGGGNGGGGGGKDEGRPPEIGYNDWTFYGAVGVEYESVINVSLGTPPITWDIISGALPPGLSLSPDVPDTLKHPLLHKTYYVYITGTPTTAGEYTFTLKAVNPWGSDTNEFSFNIYPSETHIYDFTVSGQDVYVLGYTGTHSSSNVYIMNDHNYWYSKNGVKTTIPKSDLDSVSVSNIAVSGSDVYIAGKYYITINNWYVGKACYWKNGVRTDLDDSDHYPVGDMVAAGSDVYITGYSSSPCYWKNGTRIDLPIPANATYVDPSRL
jgi:hypothetical protein